MSVEKPESQPEFQPELEQKLSPELLELIEGENMRLIYYAVQHPQFVESDSKQKILQDIKDGVEKEIKSKDLALGLLEKAGYLYPYLPEEFKEDEEIVKYAVSKNGVMLKIIPERYRHNRDIALLSAGDGDWNSATNQTNNIDYVLPEFSHDRNFVLEYVKKNGDQIWGVRTSKDPVVKKFGEEKEFLLTAVESYPMCIRGFPEEITIDNDIVLAAVNKDGMMLKYWSNTPEAERDIIFTLDTNKYKCTKKDIALAAVRNNPEAIKYVDKSLQSDSDIQSVIKK